MLAVCSISVSDSLEDFIPKIFSFNHSLKVDSAFFSFLIREILTVCSPASVSFLPPKIFSFTQSLKFFQPFLISSIPTPTVAFTESHLPLKAVHISDAVSLIFAPNSSVVFLRAFQFSLKRPAITLAPSLIFTPNSSVFFFSSRESQSALIVSIASEADFLILSKPARKDSACAFP